MNAGTEAISGLSAVTVPFADGVEAWSRLAPGWPAECAVPWLNAEFGRVTERQFMTIVTHLGRPLTGALWYVLDGSEDRRGYSAYDLLLGSQFELAVGRLGPERSRRQAEADRLRTRLSAAALAPCVSLAVPGAYEPAVIWDRQLAPEDLGVALRGLLAAIQEAAGSECARCVAILGVPEGPEGEALCRVLDQEGYSGTAMPATTVLDIPDDGLYGYLSRLGAKRRKKCEREMRCFTEEIDEVSVHTGERLLSPDIVRLVEARYTRYGHKTSRAAVEDRLKRAQDLPGITVLVAERQGCAAAFKAFVIDAPQRRIVSRFGGCEPNDYYAYFNMAFYEPIRYGAARGLTSMALGDESYRAKVLRGSRVEPRKAYIRPLDPALRPTTEAACGLRAEVEHERLTAELA